MALRFIEVRLPADVHEEVHGLAESHDLIDHWHVPADDMAIHRFLIESSNVEALLDAIVSRFGDTARIVVMPVEATLPRKPEPPAVDTTPAITPEPAQPKNPNRVSREELYEDIGDRIALTPVFLALAAASAAVACLGLVRDDTVAVIGAMVIAPLLGPNVALALASTLGDVDLWRKALRSGLAGITVSLAVAVAFGFFLDVDPAIPEIADRLRPDLGSVALALVSGVAAGLAFTTGLPASLIGVMVAVALLPPLATGGLLIGSGHVRESGEAFLLLGVNLIAVNLAGVGTFLAQGVRPTFSGERERASRAARRALAAWTLLLVGLVAGILALREGWIS